MEKTVELLQVSSLEDYEWPEQDPHSVPQRTRSVDESDLNLVRRCLLSAKINMEAFHKSARKDGLTDPQKVLALLAHRKFQMNPAGAVKAEPTWLECVETAMSTGQPVDVVYPQFCVIPNAPKRYTNVGITAGEDCTIEFFKFINAHVQEVYAPGVRFHVLADASLYASAFQTHQIEVDAYYRSLESRIAELDPAGCVVLHDYSELLTAEEISQDYLERYYEIARRVWAGQDEDIEEIIPNTDTDTLRRSVRCSVNTRRFQLKHVDHLALFGTPDDAVRREHPKYGLIERLTDIAYREAITIRLACGEIDISSRLWPGALRASCHKGPKNDRWPIGLRPYPEYYGSCKLLPYHGMPLISQDSKGRPKLEIVPEVLLRGREDLVRATFMDSDEVYAYIAEEIDAEEHSDAEYSRPIGMRCAIRGEEND